MTTRAGEAGPARQMAAATATILGGVAVTAVLLPADVAVEAYTVAAYGVGVSLVVSTAIEASASVRNLMRVDLLLLWLLYGLTLLEFLFPQPGVDAVVSPNAAVDGTYAVLLGFAGLAVGRHLVPVRRRSVQDLPAIDFRPGNIFLLFVLTTVFGYLHIFLSVNFDLFEVLRQMALPRFSQSWGRGKLGDVYSLLYELGMLIGLIPPLAGLVYARAKDFGLLQKIVVTAVLALTLYYGFVSGTRNVVVTYVISLVGAYFLLKPGMTLRRMIAIGMPVFGLLMVAVVLMLEFRTRGFANFSFEERHYESLYIDRNIINVSQLTQVFPNAFDYLGLELPFAALIRPIPRALWPGKPEGLSVGIEDALGATGLTISSTFVGEAYMSGGYFGVLLFGLLFGVAAQLWNRVGADIHSSFSQVLYASGFICAAIGMRSMLSMTPLMLPTFALWLYGKLWLPKMRLRRASGPASMPGGGGR